MKRKIQLLLLPVLLTLLVLGAVGTLGCKASVPTPPAVPDPPQVTVLKYTKIAALANNTAAHTLAELCPAPPAKSTLDADTCAETAAHLRMAARVFDQIEKEATSSDSWPVMRVKLAGIAASTTVSVVVPNTKLQQQLDQIQILIMQILGVQ